MVGSNYETLSSTVVAVVNSNDVTRLEIRRSSGANLTPLQQRQEMTNEDGFLTVRRDEVQVRVVSPEGRGRMRVWKRAGGINLRVDGAATAPIIVPSSTSSAIVAGET